VHSRAKRAVSVVEEAIWWALQAHVSVYVRKKGRGDGAVSVRLTAHRARGRLGFRFSSPRAFQMRRVVNARPALLKGSRMASAARPRAHDALVAGADHATPRSAIRQSLPR
jgi:hypothetical protein